ncbi:MAG: AAA family ATPase [Sandaracinaceae bacterium]|nr:AAA family ATPase [Sandaracinaceae bacterium]
MRPLSLLGMSGVGKSHWAKKLEARGWLRIDCDTEIARRLGELLTIGEGEEPVHALGTWMGMPWTRGYREREAAYLTLEEQVTSDALDRAHTASSAGREVVVDCTGSVIYLPSSVLRRLEHETHVVYLRTPDARREAMLARYLAEPKPVVWGESFAPHDDEHEGRGLSRLYPELLRFRDTRYSALAVHTLDGGWLETAGDDEGLAAILERDA